MQALARASECFRTWKEKTKKRDTVFKEVLSNEELEIAETKILRDVQRRHFEKEIKRAQIGRAHV